MMTSKCPPAPFSGTRGDNQAVVDAADMRVSSSLSLLERIVMVKIDRVVKRDGHHHFVLSVYLHHEHQKTPVSRITPEEFFFRTRSRDSSGSNRGSAAQLERAGEPDYQVEHRFSEFVELRHALRAIAHASHSGFPKDHQGCALCGPMLEYISHNTKQPRNGLQLVSTAKMRRELLTTFMRRIIEMVVSAGLDSRSLNPPCEAALQATLLLEQFLRKPRDSSLGII